STLRGLHIWPELGVDRLLLDLHLRRRGLGHRRRAVSLTRAAAALLAARLAGLLALPAQGFAGLVALELLILAHALLHRRRALDERDAHVAEAVQHNDDAHGDIQQREHPRVAEHRTAVHNHAR